MPKKYLAIQDCKPGTVIRWRHYLGSNDEDYIIKAVFDSYFTLEKYSGKYFSSDFILSPNDKYCRISNCYEALI